MPRNFTQDIPRQFQHLLTFIQETNDMDEIGLKKFQLAAEFVNAKLSQYESLLKTLHRSNPNVFTQEVNHQYALRSLELKRVIENGIEFITQRIESKRLSQVA